MTRKSEGATAGLRRGRTLATAGLGAATLVGGLVFAMPANAATATNPTVTLVAPAELNNDGTAAGLTIEVNNSQTGNADITNAALALSVTIPAGLTCSDVTLTVPVGSPDLNAHTSGTSGTCTYQSDEIGAPSVAAGSDTTYPYTIGVNGTQTHPGAPTTYVTGTITSTASLDATNGSGVYVSTIASSTPQTTALLTAGAATFVSGTAPAATVYLPYSYTLLDNPGYPAVPADFTAYGRHKNADGTYSQVGPYTASDTSTKDASGNELWDISLPGTAISFQLAVAPSGQVVSGKYVASSSDLDYTDPSPYYTITIVANNGTGGASGAVAANGYTPALVAGDVASPAFTPYVLFGDVPVGSTFANDIYTLAGDNIINGQLDGNFNATGAVTRASFAAFAVRELNEAGYGLATGPCTSASPSAFPDVANSSLFCSEINDLAAQNVVTGYKDGTFGPDTKVSRQVVAAFFYRIQAWNAGAQVTDATPVNTKFADVTSKNIFSGDINWAVNSTPTTIIQGYGDGTFRPTGVATRQVTAAYLARFGQDYLSLFPGVTGL